MQPVLDLHKNQFHSQGYSLLYDVYNYHEVANILQQIEQSDKEKTTYRKFGDLYAIRQLLREIPHLWSVLYNDCLKSIIQHIFGTDYFIVKSMYFDKPTLSNWHVLYHQDLTISVDKKVDLTDYGPWSVKQNQYAVQPPRHILGNISTIRIHLDDTDSTNGALNVIEGSHQFGIIKDRSPILYNKKEVSCQVPKGGIMLMKPLLFHNSNRSTSERPRRIIHIEIASKELPSAIQWSERMPIA